MLPFPEDDVGKAQVIEGIPVSKHGDLELTGSDEISFGEGRLRQYCNRWGWRKDRPAMLLDLRRVVAEILAGVDNDESGLV